MSQRFDERRIAGRTGPKKLAQLQRQRSDTTQEAHQAWENALQSTRKMSRSLKWGFGTASVVAAVACAAIVVLISLNLIAGR